ncbi:MAG TPA: AmmeMemoRadiSam system radical SAM enzyme [Verrucomicrobia bacterium]|nr:MAG: AmmeMemoRadiSam system radical SAM enzyme [Lentisphaerae bacterium GWF2_57_35]HBA86120.1 AmmeMemoRadiSam system radical SAM enzyme [Verrucomicrobiota bacterium]
MNVQCELCPKRCDVAPGESGECRIRVNLDGKLLAVTYGYPCSVHVDPVEKKPVFHFLPGTSTFSLATVGCNLHCLNCQNWEISQQNPEDVPASPLPPEDVVRLAQKHGCRSVSYTYTDPVVYYEYTLDCCRRVREGGLKNVLVTAGYINAEPWRELLREVDAARIDLKSMSDAFYRDVCGATLNPVLAALTTARSMVPLVEVIHLVIPTLNDRDEDLTQLCRWIKENLGPDAPLHFSRFFPQYRMHNLPPTPLSTLERAKQIAETEGLRYIYMGNISERESANTYCPSCRNLLIRRSGYRVLENHLREGRCPKCRSEIYGIWK